MLRGAWGRSFALLMRRPGALVIPNLQATLAAGLLALAFAALSALGSPAWALVLFEIFCGLAAWMLASWMAYAARQSFEAPRFKPGLSELKAWLAFRLRERLLSFGLALAALFWMGLALAFYRSAIERFWLAAAALALCLLFSFAGSSALALDFGLSSRREANFRAEWKAALLMGLAFAPQCFAGLAGCFLALGGGALMAGPAWMARLFWSPLLALPVFSAALIAAFWVALSDEFLAGSLGHEPPAYEPFHIKELLRPWR
jgi:hypothetical protein